MNKAIVVGVIVVGVLVAGMLYVIEHSSSRAVTEPVTDASARARHEAQPHEASTLAAPEQGVSRADTLATSIESVPSDPRLAALMVSPASNLIEFVPGPDGKVIKEIDQDPSSLGFKKPSREYSYRNGRVVGLTAYRHLSDHIEITKIAVSYKPDGSVDQYLESISTEYRGQTARVR